MAANPYEFDANAIAHAAINLGMAIPWDPNATGVSAAGAAVSITLTPNDAALFVELGQIEFSYSAAPTGGGLTITDGGTTVYQLDIGAIAGPQSIQFLQPRCARVKGNSIVVTLAGGGGAVVGKLNVHAWARR